MKSNVGLLCSAGILMNINLKLVFIFAFIIVVCVSFGFEIFSLISGLGRYDIWDAVATIIGGTVGLGLCKEFFGLFDILYTPREGDECFVSDTGVVGIECIAFFNFGVGFPAGFSGGIVSFDIFCRIGIQESLGFFLFGR